MSLRLATLHAGGWALYPELGHRLNFALAANVQRRALMQFVRLDVENANSSNVKLPSPKTTAVRMS